VHALLVAATSGDSHGEAELEPDDAECVVELKLYHSLAVEVVDRSAHPVEGAHVALFWGDFDPLEDRNTRVTDALGRVWIPKLEEQIWSEGYRGTVRLSLGGGVPCEPEVVLFTMDAVPTEPVRLVAGDFGSVAVQLCDPTGKELTLDGWADLEIELDSVPEPSLGLRGGASLQMPLRSGRAVFGCVGLGLVLEVGAYVAERECDWRDVMGPRDAGEQMTVLIPVAERTSTIARGHVRGYEDTFAGKRPTRLRGTGHEGGWFEAFIGKDAAFESSFRWPVEKLGGPWILELSSVGGPIMRTGVVPRMDEAANILDFGEVVFAPASVLTRARVIDESGAVVPWAMISIQWTDDTSYLQCDEEGLCRIAGHSTDLPVKLRARTSSKLQSEWVQIDSPVDETTLILRSGALLRGQVLLPLAGTARGNLDYLDLALSVEPSMPGAEETRFEAELVEGGRFRFDLCEPGRGTLTISYAGQGLCERSGIELIAGQTTELDPIDLRSALNPFALSFELASGEPWRGGHFEVLEPDGRFSTWTTIGPSGRAAFLSPRSTVDLWVAAKGTRPMLFEGVLDGDRLTLPGAPSVLLRVPDDVRLPEPPLALMVYGQRVKPETVPYEDDEIEDIAVREDGTAVLQVAWPGDYELWWWVRHTGTGLDFAIEREPQTIQVPDGTSPVIELQLTREELELAVLDAGG
jgi:hypothetical protein